MAGSNSIDDTCPLFCTIESAQTLGDHVEYRIKVQRGHTSDDTWVVSRRYSDFAALDSALKVSGIALSFPPKKVFGSTSREFIAERQVKLQLYLNAVLSNQFLANSIHTKRFLHDDKYHENFQEIALQHISMFLRSEPEWEVIEPLPDFGCRLRKIYFLVKNITSPKERYILSWTALGPYNNLEEKEQSVLLKTLSTLQHPYLFPIVLSSGNKSGAIVIRPYQEIGSIRDQICRTKPKSHYLKKYATPKAVSPFKVSEIKTYGRQLLDFMKYMTEKSFPLGHLHPGNLFIQDGKIQVTDIANFMLGVPTQYRTFITNHKKCSTLDQMDIYSFGHIIYEMAFGTALKGAQLESLPPNCPPELASLLEWLLKSDSIKAGLPTIDDLIQSPFFSGVSLKPSEKPQVKIPTKLKESLRNAKSRYELSIQEEQRIINQMRKRNKVRAHHMSEEEKKKRKMNLKLQKSVSQGDDDRSIQLSSNNLDSPSDGSKRSSVKQTEKPSTPKSGVPAPPPPPGPSVAGPPPPPPPPAAPAPPPPPPAAVPTAVAKPDTGRSALLSSISGFSKNKLKKATTVDKSAPKL